MHMQEKYLGINRQEFHVMAVRFAETGHAYVL